MAPQTEADLRRLDTPEGRHESLIDTFASWALERFVPSQQDIELGKAYLQGRMSPAEIIEKMLEQNRLTSTYI
jgi:hypothetical protein